MKKSFRAVFYCDFYASDGLKAVRCDGEYFTRHNRNSKIVIRKLISPYRFNSRKHFSLNHFQQRAAAG